ncbi:hypothetical protein Sango_2685900 [Sesamum angolense]|uniref:Transposase MuDR plant domain-containing protein n=1 Tax=Sesamum angolense TaxID=2727404 RepID=A0AAE1W2P1_9LAMI|nr:hypothetical protein Sango_2685900 [Sesamum angolense]
MGTKLTDLVIHYNENGEEGADNEEDNDDENESDNSEAETDNENIATDDPTADIDGGSTDYASDEIPHNYAMTDDDCEDPKLNNGGKDFALPSDPLEKIKLEKGMLFSLVDTFRLALREYAIREGFKVIRDKNKKERVTAHCDGKGCKWRIHASVAPNGISFMIKTYIRKHTCVRVDKNKEATASWMTNKLVDVLRENPIMKCRGMRHELQKFGVNPPYMRLYRAKKIAILRIKGNHTASFGML